MLKLKSRMKKLTFEGENELKCGGMNCLSKKMAQTGLFEKVKEKLFERR